MFSWVPATKLCLSLKGGRPPGPLPESSGCCILLSKVAEEDALIPAQAAGESLDGDMKKKSLHLGHTECACLKYRALSNPPSNVSGSHLEPPTFSTASVEWGENGFVWFFDCLPVWYQSVRYWHLSAPLPASDHPQTCGNNTPWWRYGVPRTTMPVHVRASAEQQRNEVLFVGLLQDYIQDTIAEWRRLDIDVLLCPVIGPAFNLLYCGKNSRTVHWTAGCVACRQVAIMGEIHWTQKAVYKMNTLRLKGTKCLIYQRQLYNLCIDT